MMSHTK